MTYKPPLKNEWQGAEIDAQRSLKEAFQHMQAPLRPPLSPLFDKDIPLHENGEKGLLPLADRQSPRHEEPLYALPASVWKRQALSSICCQKVEKK